MSGYITININPVPVHVGPVPIHWYGVIMAIALLVGAYVFSRQLSKRGISSDHAFGMLLPAIPLGIIGARLFHILDNFSWTLMALQFEHRPHTPRREAEAESRQQRPSPPQSQDAS